MDADIYYDELGKDMRVEPIPEDMVDLANEYREKLLDAVSMFDDEIMEMYLEGEEIPTDKIRAAIRRATVAVEMVPVVCGTSYRNKGVQKLLDAIVDYMPAPTDIPAIKGVNPKTDEEEDRKPSDDEPVLRAGLQDHDRPLCGPSELLPRLFRHAEHRLRRAQRHQEQAASAWAVSCRCTRTTARTSRRSTPAISPPPSV